MERLGQGRLLAEPGIELIEVDSRLPAGRAHQHFLLQPQARGELREAGSTETAPNVARAHQARLPCGVALAQHHRPGQLPQLERRFRLPQLQACAPAARLACEVCAAAQATRRGLHVRQAAGLPFGQHAACKAERARGIEVEGKTAQRVAGGMGVLEVSTEQLVATHAQLLDLDPGALRIGAQRRFHSHAGNIEHPRALRNQDGARFRLHAAGQRVCAVGLQHGSHADRIERQVARPSGAALVRSRHGDSCLRLPGWPCWTAERCRSPPRATGASNARWPP